MKPKFQSGAFRRYSNAEIEWGDVINTGTTTLGQVLTSIFGRNYSYQADANAAMLDQERRNNTILWIAIGVVLVMAMIIVLVKANK